MERFGGGLKKGGAAVATFQPSVGSAKGKFRLRTSRDPLPLVTSTYAIVEHRLHESPVDKVRFLH